MSVVVDKQVRDRLKHVREELASARDERAEAIKERDAAKQAFTEADHGDKKITEWPEFEAAEQATGKVGKIEDKINDLKEAEHGILQMLGDIAPGEVAEQLQNVTEGPGGWNGHNLLGQAGQDTAYQKAVEAGIFTSGARFGTVMLGQIATREQAVEFLSALPAAPAGPVSSGDMAGAIQPDRRGLIQPLLRPLRLLDLIPTGTTDSNSIEYVQVQAVPGSASGVAEGELKPQQGLVLEDATAPVRTIAGWIKVNRQAMDDTAGLATLINTLLPYDVRRKLESQIIAGDGSGQNLTGLLNQTGLGVGDFVAGDNLADVILRAMTVVILSEAEPNFAALHPLSWQDLLLMRTNEAGANTGAYLYGGPQMMAAPSIWGLTVVPSVVIPEASPLVGDSRGATLLVREGVNVKTSDSDQDDFVRNRVTILAEGRFAFPVWRPASFAVATRS